MRLLNLQASLCVGLFLLPVALMAQGAPPQTTTTPGEKMAEDVFKNIQVFKGKPASQIQPTMTYMASALGTECAFCHANPFDADTKGTKKTAREMIQMVFDINKNNFNGQNRINCFTCHQGHTQPRSNLSIATDVPAGGATPAAGPGAQAPGRGGPGGSGGPGGTPGAGGAPGQNPRPAAQAVLDKYAQAMGGQPALDSIQSVSITATRNDGTNSNPETIVRDAGMFLITDNRQGATQKTGFDGTAIWAWDSRGGLHDLGSDTQGVARTDADLYPGASLKAQGAQVQGPQPVGDRSAWVISMRGPGGVGRYYFDTETGMLLRYTTSTPTILGALPLQVDFSDYKPVHGVQMPFTVTYSNASRIWTRKITDIKVNGPADAAAFKAPAAPAGGGLN